MAKAEELAIKVDEKNIGSTTTPYSSVLQMDYTLAHRLDMIDTKHRVHGVLWKSEWPFLAVALSSTEICLRVPLIFFAP